MGKIQIENKMVQNVLPICLTFHRKIQEKKNGKRRVSRRKSRIQTWNTHKQIHMIYFILRQINTQFCHE